MRCRHDRLISLVWSLLVGIQAACAPGPRVSPGSVRDPAPVSRPPVPGAPAGVTAFVNVAVVPMDTERVLASHTVMIEGGRITAIGPSDRIRVPAGALRIDGQGKYLLPGLADMHVHIGISASSNDKYDSLAAQDRLFLWLASGVTTIRNMDYLEGWTLKLNGPTLLRLRARAAAGELWSPRIYTSAQWGPRHYLGQIYSHDSVLVASAPPPRLDSVIAYVTAYKAAGYDHLKTYGHESPEVWDSMVVAARRVGLPIVGHLPGKQHDRALAEYRSVEHRMEYFFLAGDAAKGRPQDTSRAHVRAIAETIRRAGIWVSPTVGMGWGRQAPPGMVPALQEAGVGVLLGSDAPVMLGTLVAVHRELEKLVQLGLTPYQALVTATRNPAVYFGALDETGTVAVGKRADLVLLAGNPLADIRYTRLPAGVMIGGRWLTREEIDRRLPSLNEHWAKPEAMHKDRQWLDQPITSR